jgi:hypothetical protein
MTISRVGTGASAELNPGTSTTLNKPTGTGSGHVCVIEVSWFEGSGLDLGANTPTGFTLRGNLVIGGGGAAESRVAVFTRDCDGSEPASWTVSLTGSSFATWIADTYSGDGALTYASIVTGTAASGTTCTSPSVAGTAGQGLICPMGTSDPTTMTTPSGMAAGTAGLQNTNTCRLFYETLGSTGATGTRASTLGTSRENGGFSILLNDAGGGGGATIYTRTPLRSPIFQSRVVR